MDRVFFRAVLAVMGCSATALGQQVQLQLPVRQVFGIDTAVRVPDQGAILLGGVSSAASGWQSYGPLPWGTSQGRVVTDSQAWGRVWIHDLQALDEALLEEARSRVKQQDDRSGSLQGTVVAPAQVLQQAERARQQLLRPAAGSRR